MPMSLRPTLLIIRVGAALMTMLLAGIAWQADHQLRIQHRAAARAVLDEVASERKQQINTLLARFAAEVAAGVSESSPERWAELESMVRPRLRPRASDDAQLLDAEGRDVIATDGVSQGQQTIDIAAGAVLAPCLAGGDASTILPDAKGGEQVVTYRALPVHGLCLLMTADLAEFPVAPRGGLAWWLVAVALLLSVTVVLAERAIQRAAAQNPPPLQTSPSTDKHAAIQKLLPGGISEEDFLGRVSHEVRTPLNGVLGTLELLLKTPLDGSQRELAELARVSGEELLAAIDDILENPGGHASKAGSFDFAGFAGERVLLVEDNTTNQIVARLMLTQLGCVVEVAADGRDALRMLDGADYDAVLMDCEMPGLDGYATTANIRRRADPKARVPIIALTAQAMAGDRERCLAAGMDDYLSKPVTGEALAITLRRWLRPADVQPDVSLGGTTSSVQDEAPAIDPAVILRLRELALATDPALLAQILEAFRKDGAQHIAAMEAAIAADDRPALLAAAHVIKGASCTVGATALAALVQQIYALPPDAPLPAARDLIRHASREFVRALDEIARLEPTGE